MIVTVGGFCVGRGVTVADGVLVDVADAVTVGVWLAVAEGGGNVRVAVGRLGLTVLSAVGV